MPKENHPWLIEIEKNCRVKIEFQFPVVFRQHDGTPLPGGYEVHIRLL
jgi:hypothetical protein